MARREAQSNNPIFTRIGTDKDPARDGFAYAEGRAAYDAAGAPVDAAQLQEIYDRPSTGIPGRLALNDVIMKTALCLVLTVAGAVVGWNLAEPYPWVWIVAAVVGLVLGLVNSFKKKVSPPLVMLYALVEGVFLGGISYWYNELAIANDYYGLVQQAVLGTLVAFGVMLALYTTNIIKVNGRFMKIFIVALVSYGVIALASLVAALFGVGEGWGFYGVGGLGILLCVVGVGLAAFSLALDFEAIKRGIQMGMPERESWRMSFGLLVTLVWLYLEILRLITIVAASSR